MYYVHGNINDNRSCTTAKFAVEGILFENSYERRSLKVKVETMLGYVDVQGQLVTFANGIRAPYDVGMARDHRMGAIIWPVVKGKCYETMSSIYLGPAQLYDNKELNYAQLVGI